MKKTIGSLVMVLAISMAGLSVTSLWGITPTAPKHKCFEDFEACSIWAAMRDTFLQRTLAEADCELDLASCIANAF